MGGRGVSGWIPITWVRDSRWIGLTYIHVRVSGWSLKSLLQCLMSHLRAATRVEDDVDLSVCNGC